MQPHLPAFVDQRRLPDADTAVAPAPVVPAPDEAAARIKAEEDRLTAKDEQNRRQAEELKRRTEELEVERKADEERRLWEELAARKKAEDEKQSAAEAEVARRANDERLNAKEAEAQRQTEELKRRHDQIEAQQKAAEQQKRSDDANKGPATAASPDDAAKSAGSNAKAVKSEPRAAHVNIPAMAVTCPNPSISSEPLTGGRSTVVMVSQCRAGQTADLKYGPLLTHHPVDNSGRAEFIVDLFLGADIETVVITADGGKWPVKPLSSDLGGVTKIAVLWQAAVNLDLHAFEYAAAPGEPGHIWSGNPRDSAAAAALLARDGRGHGFMSSSDEGQHEGTKAEVFTFWRSKTQDRGTVAMALDYETRGSKAQGETCGSGKNSEIAIEVVVLEPSAEIAKQSGLIPAIPCGTAIPAASRYRSGQVPDIRIRH